MDTIPNAALCDSVITVNLTIRTETFATINPDVCDSYTSPSGKIWTTSNTYSDTIQSAAGCDSIITVNLTIRNSTTSTISPDVCDSYISPKGDTYYTSATFNDTLINAANCDSIITVNLTVRHKTFATINPSVCDSFISPKGDTYYASASFIDTIPNAALCDSVITVNLNVRYATSSNRTDTIYESYTSPSGIVKTTSEIFNDTIPNAALCDSVITIDLTVLYHVLFVDSAGGSGGSGGGWGSPFSGLQGAFDYAMIYDVDTICVGLGTYFPSSSPDGSTDPRDYSLFIADSNIVICGGINPATELVEGKTVLCGDLIAAGTGTDSVYHVFSTVGLDTTTVISNFIVCAGKATGTDTSTFGTSDFYSYFGGGLYNHNSSPKLVDVVITGNRAESNGGGLYNHTGNPLLKNVTIKDNHAAFSGGGMYNIAGASPILCDVTIEDNTAAINGGGMFNVSSCYPVLKSVTIRGNTAGLNGGGMYNRSTSSPTMTNVVLDSNTASGNGGGMYNEDYSSPTLSNVVIAKNSATNGGGIYNRYLSNPVITGGSVCDNGGGGISNNIALPTISNTWFFGNTGADISNTSSMIYGTNNASDVGTSSPANVGSGFVDLSSSTMSDILVDGSDIDGADNVWMTADDGFAGVACGPLNGAGDNASVSGIAGDIISGDRIIGDKVDIGAYEANAAMSLKLPTVPGIYTSDKAITQGDWTYYVNCGSGDLILALDLDGSGAVVPANGASIKLGTNKTVSWIDAGGLITNTKGGAMIDRRWNVSPTTQPTGTVGVKYYFTEAEYTALKDTLANHNGGAAGYATIVNDVTELGMFKITNNSSFLDPHNTGVNGIILSNHASTPSTSQWVHSNYGTDHEAEFKVTSFSGGGGGNGGGSSALPVELIEFAARGIDGHQAVLDWTTASEINNSHFMLERSYDGEHFEEVARVEGTGTTQEVINYNFVDETISKVERVVYYRLHQFDFDGQNEYSTVRVVEFDNLQEDAVHVYPNPARDAVYVRVDTRSEEEVTVELVNLSGQVLHTEVITSGDHSASTRLDLTEYQSGIYFVQVKSSTSNYFYKIVKQ
jgi:hypothetical protein